MTFWLVNPGRGRTRRKKMAKKRRTTTKRRRFSAKQLAAQRKFAAMARARARAAKTRKRASGGSMARKRRKATPRRRVMRSVRRGGKAISQSAWRASGYRRNPRRGRRRYRRNPGGGILNQTMDLVKASGTALVGAAVGRTVSNMIPVGNGTPLVNFAKGTAVAIAIRVFGARFLGAEAARLAAVGAMLGPTKDLIVSFVPQAEQFLGSGDGVMLLPPIQQFSAYAPQLEAGGGEDVAGGFGVSAYAPMM